MKKLIILCLCVFFYGRSISQFKEMDEKLEFLGIPFLSAPDYSQLNFRAEAKNNINVYTFKNQKTFTTPDYSLSTIYIGIRKGRILNFTIELTNDADYNKINQQLAEVFTEKGQVTIGDMYFGKNLTFYIWEQKGKKNLFINTDKQDTIPDVQDKTGIIGLLGKKDSDPDVTKFIASIPGKKEKQVYSTGGYGYSWPGEGIAIDFTGAAGEERLSGIFIYFMKDKYYWKDKPFRGAIKLPYDITAPTSANQLRDLFGDADPSSNVVVKDKNWNKFRVYCTFGNPITKSDYHLLNYVAFK